MPSVHSKKDANADSQPPDLRTSALDEEQRLMATMHAIADLFNAGRNSEVPAAIRIFKAQSYKNPIAKIVQKHCIHRFIGIFKVQSGDFSKALRYLDRAEKEMDLLPADTHPEWRTENYSLQATAHIFLGNTSAAIKYYDKSLAALIDPLEKKAQSEFIIETISALTVLNTSDTCEKTPNITNYTPEEIKHAEGLNANLGPKLALILNLHLTKCLLRNGDFRKALWHLQAAEPLLGNGGEEEKNGHKLLAALQKIGVYRHIFAQNLMGDRSNQFTERSLFEVAYKAYEELGKLKLPVEAEIDFSFNCVAYFCKTNDLKKAFAHIATIKDLASELPAEDKAFRLLQALDCEYQLLRSYEIDEDIFSAWINDLKSTINQIALQSNKDAEIETDNEILDLLNHLLYQVGEDFTLSPSGSIDINTYSLLLMDLCRHILKYKQEFGEHPARDLAEAILITASTYSDYNHDRYQNMFENLANRVAEKDLELKDDLRITIFLASHRLNSIFSVCNFISNLTELEEARIQDPHAIENLLEEQGLKFILKLSGFNPQQIPQEMDTDDYKKSLITLFTSTLACDLSANFDRLDEKMAAQEDLGINAHTTETSRLYLNLLEIRKSIAEMVFEASGEGKFQAAAQLYANKISEIADIYKIPLIKGNNQLF